MGCCTRFHRTWWPGYTSEEIDADKAFNFQRRLSLIKKLIGILLLLALIGGIIYFLVSYLSGGSQENCPKNGTETTNRTFSNSSKNDSLDPHPESQALNQATILTLPSSPSSPSSSSLSRKNSTGESKDKPPTTVHNDTVHNNISSPSLPPTLPPDSQQNLIFPEETSHTNMTGLVSNSNEIDADLITRNDTVVVHQNDTIEEIISPSNSWCSSENVVECIGLTKSFRNITTFKNNSPKKVKRPVEGYIMVKGQSNEGKWKWHPYCREVWSLDMGYKICTGLGFHQLIQITHINILDLERRVKQSNKNISLVSHGNTNNTSVNVDKQKCKAGFISCE